MMIGPLGFCFGKYSVTHLAVDKAQTNEPRECTQKYTTEDERVCNAAYN